MSLRVISHTSLIDLSLIKRPFCLKNGACGLIGSVLEVKATYFKCAIGQTPAKKRATRRH